MLRDKTLIESLRKIGWVQAADYIKELEAENERLGQQCEGLMQAGMNNGQALILAEAKLAKAVELLEAWGDVAVHCSIEEGVCCCGDDMENHSNPMDCGHSPVDHGAYVAMQLVEATRTTLAELTGGKDE